MTLKIIEPLEIREPEAEYKVERKNNDVAWKEVLDTFLPDFFRLCLPELAKLIDWTKPPESLDSELHALTKDFRTGTRIVDKLFKIYLLDGTEQRVLVHLEVQGESEDEFPERMFICSFRSYDKYRRPILSCAILTDTKVDWRPDRFEVSFGDSCLSLKYNVIKLIDYEAKREELEQSPNPFASVILVQLDALKARRQPSEKQLNIKIALTRRLYKQGLTKKQAMGLYYFIDWLIKLSPEDEKEYLKQIHELEQENHMAYVSTAELFGMEEGFNKGILQGRQEGREEGRRTGHQEGKQEGEAALLTRQLTYKFKHIPEKYQRKIQQANVETLLVWGEKMLDAKLLEEVFE